MNTEELLKWYKGIITKIPCDVFMTYENEFKELDSLIMALLTDRKLYQRRYEMIKNEYEHSKKLNNKEVQKNV